MKRGFISAAVFGIALAGFVSAAAPAGSPAHPEIRWGGRAVAVAVDPNNSSHELVASESGGLFETTDGAATWQRIDSLRPFRLGDVDFAPSDSNTIIVTAWSDSRTANGGGIWRSTNGGSTWNQATNWVPPSGCSFSRPNAWGIAFAPDARNVYVGTDCGVAVSTDLGASWTPRPLSTTKNVSVSAGGIVDTCSADGHHRSTDSGRTFPTLTPLAPAGVSSACSGIDGLAVSPTDTNVLFSAVNDGPNAPPPTCHPTETRRYWTVSESDNGGLVWNEIGRRCPSSRSSWVVTGPAGNENSFVLYWSSGAKIQHETCSSTSTGQRCPTFGTTPDTVDHDDVNGIALAGMCPTLLATDGGPETTSDCGSTYRNAGAARNGYTALQLYEVTGQLQPDHTDLYIGTQDNSLWASADSGATWDNEVRAEGFALQIARRASSHDRQRITGTKCWPCTNFDETAHFAAPGPPAWADAPGGGGNPFLVGPNAWVEFGMGPGGASVLYAYVGGLVGWVPLTTISQARAGTPQRSGPSGTFYQPFNTGIRTSAGDNIYGLLRVVFGGRRPPRVIRADSGLGGIGQYNFGQGTFGWPVVYGADPSDARYAIAADVVNGQMMTTSTGGVRVGRGARPAWRPDPALTRMMTDDGTFRFNIPPNEDTIQKSPGVNLQAHAIAYDPDNGNKIVVGTEAAGVVYSVDRGATWGVLQGSRRVPAVSSFFFDRGGKIWVSSYGRGLWTFDLPRAYPFALPAGPYARLASQWIRAPGNYRRRIGGPFRRASYCRTCTFVVARGGLRGLVLTPSGRVGGVDARGALLASTVEGQLARARLRVTRTARAKYLGCAACKAAIATGGSVRGFVLRNKRVVALIAGRGKLPGAGALARFQARTRPYDVRRGPALAPPAGPYINIAGSVPVNGGAATAADEPFTIYGRGFCEQSCGLVTISIGGDVVATTQPEKGKVFSASADVDLPPGGYDVVASQSDKSAHALLVVVPGGD